MSYEERLQALAQGTHHRLGRESGARHMNQDALKLVWQSVTLTAKEGFEELRRLCEADPRVVTASVDTWRGPCFSVKLPTAPIPADGEDDDVHRARVTLEHNHPSEIVVDTGDSPIEHYPDGQFSVWDVRGMYQRLVAFALDPITLVKALYELEDEMHASLSSQSSWAFAPKVPRFYELGRAVHDTRDTRRYINIRLDGNGASGGTLDISLPGKSGASGGEFHRRWGSMSRAFVNRMRRRIYEVINEVTLL